MPLILQIPANVFEVSANTETVVPIVENIAIVKFNVTKGSGWFGFLGQNCSFKAISESPFNLGIYGPNPTQIGPPFGRMRAPKINLADNAINYCQGNFKPGLYYIVVRYGINDLPQKPVKLTITTQTWQIF